MKNDLNFEDINDRHKFYRSIEWRSLRLLKLSQKPLCEICLKSGRVVEATEVHHIVDLKDSPSKSLDIVNLQSLCAHCHGRITANKKNTIVVTPSNIIWSKHRMIP